MIDLCHSVFSFIKNILIVIVVAAILIILYIKFTSCDTFRDLHEKKKEEIVQEPPGELIINAKVLEQVSLSNNLQNKLLNLELTQKKMLQTLEDLKVKTANSIAETPKAANAEPSLQSITNQPITSTQQVAKEIYSDDSGDSEEEEDEDVSQHGS